MHGQPPRPGIDRVHAYPSVTYGPFCQDVVKIPPVLTRGESDESGRITEGATDGGGPDRKIVAISPNRAVRSKGTGKTLGRRELFHSRWIVDIFKGSTNTISDVFNPSARIKMRSVSGELASSQRHKRMTGPLAHDASHPRHGLQHAEIPSQARDARYFNAAFRLAIRVRHIRQRRAGSDRPRARTRPPGMTP